jgi:hypothetical protein
VKFTAAQSQLRRGLSNIALFNDCFSSAAAKHACRITAGQSSRPCNAVPTPSHTNKTTTPALYTRSPTAAPRGYGFDGVNRQAILSAKSTIPEYRPMATPPSSRGVANKSKHANVGLMMRTSPVTNSSHAAAKIRCFCSVTISRLSSIRDQPVTIARARRISREQPRVFSRPPPCPVRLVARVRV